MDPGDDCLDIVVRQRPFPRRHAATEFNRALLDGLYQRALRMMPTVAAGVERRWREFPIRPLFAPVRRAFGVSTVTGGAIGFIDFTTARNKFCIKPMRDGRRRRDQRGRAARFYRGRWLTARDQ